MQIGYTDLSRKFDGVEEYSNAGFDFVEISLDYPAPYKLDVEKTLKILEEHSLKPAFHGPWKGLNLGHAEQHMSEAALVSFNKAIETASQFDYLYFVVHATIPTEYMRYGEFYPECVENMNNQLKKIKRENHFVENLPDGHYLTTPEKMKSVDANYCLDVGHAVRTSKDRKIKDWFKELGSKIIAVHFHDVLNLEADHLFFGLGDLNIEHLLEDIKKTNTKYLMLETYNSEKGFTIGKEAAPLFKKEIDYCLQFL